MPDFPLNSSVRAVVRIKDTYGSLVDATTVTVTFTKPDATTTTPSVTHDGTGIYHADQTVSSAGTWSAVESSTGVVTATGAQTFTVA